MTTNNEFNIKATGRIAVITEKRVEQAHKNHLALYSGLMMDKSKAIEKMAIAMFEWQRPGSRGDVPIEDVWQNEKSGFENLAEAALDALLAEVEDAKH